MYKISFIQSMTVKSNEKTGFSSSSSSMATEKKSEKNLTKKVNEKSEKSDNLEIPKNVKNIGKDRTRTPKKLEEDIGYIESKLSKTILQSNSIDSTMDYKINKSTPNKNDNTFSVVERPRQSARIAILTSPIAMKFDSPNKPPFSGPGSVTISGKRKSLSPVPFPVNGFPITCPEENLSFEIISGEIMCHYLFLITSLPLSNHFSTSF